jgi:hypothetical protein
MDAARHAVERVLQGHEPYPALAIDRHWTLLAANRAVTVLLAGVDPSLLEPPVNVLRVSLHPYGLAPRIVNLTQWRAHLLERVRYQVEVSADPVLEALLAELRAYPVPETRDGTSVLSAAYDDSGVFVPLSWQRMTARCRRSARRQSSEPRST